MLLSTDKSSLFDDEGVLWFHDLTQKDPTFILPLTAIAISYLGIDVALLGSTGRLAIALKDVFQTLLLISVPFVAVLPCGVFCYWIPSSAFGILQSLVLRSTYFQRLLRIPPVVKPKHLQPLVTNTKN